ncbi:hypothetical protein Avbf_19192 [Armadillidium vulgare]|nr:hypothetical protein Avbf_19192 [Armadillidium vulgare]
MDRPKNSSQNALSIEITNDEKPTNIDTNTKSNEDSGSSNVNPQPSALHSLDCTFPFHSSSYPMNQRLPLNNISNQFKNEICECSVRKLSSEKENIKFNFTGLNKSRHGENFNQVFYWSSSVTISGNEETLPTFESKDHFNFGENQSLASELLRETHVLPL